MKLSVAYGGHGATKRNLQDDVCNRLLCLAHSRGASGGELFPVTGGELSTDGARLMEAGTSGSASQRSAMRSTGVVVEHPLAGVVVEPLIAPTSWTPWP